LRGPCLSGSWLRLFVERFMVREALSLASGKFFVGSRLLELALA
jgi:hypothetical protein